MLKDKPNLIFLIAIRNQSLYIKLLVIPKLRRNTYRIKLAKALTICSVSTYDYWDNRSQMMILKGSILYKINGKLHKEDGPATIHCDRQVWYNNGLIHRVGGPAYTDSEGAQSWWQNGNMHRDDGPAWIKGNNEFYYINGTYMKHKI
jgi:hypothetical protein